MNGPGIRPGRMVLLTSGIVDEWLDPPWSSLSTASLLAWNLRPFTAVRALTHCWAPRDQATDSLRPPGTVSRASGRPAR
jgi:hypothetical protein